MTREVKNLTILIAALLAVTVAGFVATAPADECGPCGGPLKTVSGHGTGSSCAAAQSAAYADALAKAYQGGTSCEPCQISNGPVSCYAIDGIPPTGLYGSTWTLYHRCRSCSPGPPPIP